MRILIQRVDRAKVTVDGKVVGEIGRGFLLLIGFKINDNNEYIAKMAEKCLHLRLFEDEQGKMNKSLFDVDGELLIVSQFTLYANCRKGRRPGFDRSMPPAEAEKCYEELINHFKRSGLVVEQGIFGAKMQVDLINNGPVTIMLDDEKLFPNK